MNWIYEEGRIYYENEDKKLMAEAILTAISNDEIDIEHVYVDPSLRGQGIAGKVMEVVTKHIRENGLKTTATCSYAKSWLVKNRTFNEDIISRNENDIFACRIDGKH
ncbi:MAG: GNAT family N-acetyltransferase [Lachnospiraceae bacterium]|nr:GNAT family N-acetyltransferase [Lachnospiraceae bacterium]MDD3660900.1 GNAT family N-acetyltransferase [Lachnospiraceae bacterium]